MNALLIKKCFAVLFFLLLPLTIAPLSLRSETPATDPAASLPLSTLAVPEELGKVQERFVGHGSRTIIQIQDVHAHTVAQQNIAAMLERLRTMFGVQKVALEGAWSATSLPKSHAIPTSREKQLLAGTLLEDDRISGPVFAAIMSPDPIMLVGIEEKELYEKNRGIFLAHLGKAKEIEEKLHAYRTSLEDAQKSAWGPDLLVFGTAFGKFREDSDLGKFLPLLLETSDHFGADFSDLPQIVLLKDITTLEKSLAKERLDTEVRQVVKKYQNRPWTLEELVRGGKIPPEEIGMYPEIKKLTRLYQLRDKVFLRDLMNQIETLSVRILEKLVKTPEENALWERTERFYLAKKILLLQATPEDIKAYDNDKALLEAELAKAGLAESLVLSLSFYDVVKKRDEIFFQRVTTDPALAGDIAVVTGGFHTDGLSQKFRDAGIAYITITPDLGGTAANEKLYAERMAEKPLDQNPVSDKAKPGLKNAATQTLSELQDGHVRAELRFSPSYEALQTTHNLKTALRVFNQKTASPATTAHQAASAATGFDITEFIRQNRAEQLQVVREWLEKIQSVHQKAMLVTQVSILKKMLTEKKVADLVAEIVKGNDVLAVVQDVPLAEVPEILLASRGIERFEEKDLETLIAQNVKFKRLAKRCPFAIMKKGYQSDLYVVLPELPVSLVLYRIITLNPNLYQEAAGNPKFLLLLQDLVTEILSQQLPGTFV